MALSASLSVPLSTVPAGYVVNCHITVSNSATNGVTLQQIIPQIKSTPISFLEDKSSWSASPISLDSPQVPGSGSQSYLMRIVFHGANNGGSYDNPINTTYDLGCIIYGSDGEVVSVSPIQITVTQNSQEI